MAALIANIAFFPTRLPNHLMVALFALALIGAEWKDWSTTGLATCILHRTLLSGVFFAAGFHKLNRSFLNPKLSCGSGLVLHYLLQRGFVPHGFPSRLMASIPLLVISMELLLPVGLVFQPTTRIALISAVALVTLFGFLGHVHFAVIMLALIAAPLDPFLLLASLPLASVLAFPFALLMANVKAYRYKSLAFLNTVVLAFISLGVGTSLLYVPIHSLWSIDLSIVVNPPFVVIIFVFFALNVAAPYLGLKWDGSLAMFSNLRPDNWQHLIVRRRLRGFTPRYVRVKEVCVNGYSEPTIRDHWFSESEGFAYAVGYIDSVIRHLNKSLGTCIIITVVDIGSGEALHLSGRGDELCWYERLSTFPYVLPPADAPLCA